MNKLTTLLLIVGITICGTIQSQNEQFNVKNIAINTDHADFGSTYYKDQVVYVSTQEGIRGIRRRWVENQLPFLDIYVADLNNENELNNRARFSKQVNKKYHDGPAAFNKEGDLMVFTRNNHKEKSSEDEILLQLYYSEIEGDDWSEPQRFHFNDPEYSVGQPSLSADGKTLYFVSDMPGGFGKSDIYKVDRNSDGSWGNPVNLGNTVNTSDKEMFPFIHETGSFFFSSTAHGSVGGLDIFATKIRPNGNFASIKRFEDPVNGSADDFALIINEEMTMGFFSSNREGGKGEDDLYSFDLLSPITFLKNIVGSAMDKSGEPLANTHITLMNENGKVLNTVQTGEDGKYSFEVEPNKNFKIKAIKSDYFEASNTTSSFGEYEVFTSNITLEKDPGFTLAGILGEVGNTSDMAGSKITIRDNITGKTETVLIGEDGKFRKVLHDKKVNDFINYNIKIEKDGYLTKNVNVNEKLTEKGTIDLNGAFDLTVKKIETNAEGIKMVNFDPIYFDLDNHEIRNDAANELDKIVQILNDNPSLKIELGSYTDCRGSKSYNMRLSKKRAKASANYIKERIDNPRRIVGKGYGESKLIRTDCECENDNEENDPCTDKMHEINRRTEFKILEL